MPHAFRQTGIGASYPIKYLHIYSWKNCGDLFVELFAHGHLNCLLTDIQANRRENFEQVNLSRLNFTTRVVPWKWPSINVTSFIAFSRSLARASSLNARRSFSNLSCSSNCCSFSISSLLAASSSSRFLLFSSSNYNRCLDLSERTSSLARSMFYYCCSLVTFYRYSNRSTMYFVWALLPFAQAEWLHQIMVHF